VTTDAARVLELARSRTATLHEARLVCVDGPAGSGKTTLAAQIAALVPGTTTVHMDDLYEGWRGLDRIDEQLGALLRPLAEGRAGSYRRWDWLDGTWAETVDVAPAPLLVVEGVGSGARAVADLVTVLVWIEAPASVRRTRGLERDGAAVAAHWDRFVLDETALFVRESTRDRADLVLDGGAGGASGR
jgi:uridine kinase